MKTAILLILIDLFLCAALADAENWILIKQKQENLYLLVDKDSIEHVSDGIVRSTIKYDYRKTYSGKRAYDCRKCSIKKILSHTILIEEFDCNERKIKKLELTEHYIDKAPYYERMTEDWTSASAESIDEILINYICTR